MTMKKVSFKELMIGFFASVRVLFERIRGNKEVCAVLKDLGKLLAILLVILAYTLIICRVQMKKDEAIYAEKLEAFRLEMVSRAASDAAKKMEDPALVQSRIEAEALAKVLYGVKDNSDQDLRTMCWCVFNRVDSRNYPSTLEDVIEQPDQWMRYSENNPVLDDLYKIAQEQLQIWHGGGYRPCSADFVYMNWTPSEIVLRDAWKDGSTTHYWRFKNE